MFKSFIELQLHIKIILSILNVLCFKVTMPFTVLHGDVQYLKQNIPHSWKALHSEEMRPGIDMKNRFIQVGLECMYNIMKYAYLYIT